MKLILLRHAEAQDRAGSDYERQLTSKGRQQAQEVGKFYARTGLRIDEIYSSPYPRAMQTAEIVAGELAAPMDVIPEQDFGCGMRPERVLAFLRHCDEAANVLIVGHQPDLGVLCAFLSGNHNGGAFAIKKACSVIFDLERLCGGGGVLEAFIPACFIKKS